jgi:hypothetical protein
VIALFHYLTEVTVGGDYLNDHLVDVPEWSANAVQVAGWLLSLALGY